MKAASTVQRVALVTGCRSGFGLLTAERFGRAGWAVYAGLRSLDTAEDLERSTRGLDVTPVQLDVTRAEEREAVVERILSERGRIDALVNNAGRPLGGFLEQLGEDEVRALFDVNVFAVFSLTNLVLPIMRSQGEGTVVNVSSMSGRAALPGLGAYAASKWALEGMSEALRHELRPFGVHVVLIEPGPYKTDIFGRNQVVGRHAHDEGPYLGRARRLAELADRAHAGAGDPADVADRIVAVARQSRPRLRHPMGRASLVRELAKRLLPFAVFEVAIARAVPDAD